MRERGILFKGELVRAILAERKTQTRRLIPLSPRGFGQDWIVPPDHWQREALRRCPYGVPGDRLWVRETWYDDHLLLPRQQTPTAPDEYIYYRADGEAGQQFEQLDPPNARIWRPAIYMPRWASRITLDVVDVRAQRLQEITEADAVAEGLPSFFERFPNIGREQCLTSGERAADAPHRASFAVLWDEINGDRALWFSNPWVWAITFRRLL